MKQSTKDAYAEVDAILNLMDEKYVKQIPKKLRTLIKASKTKDYKKIFISNKPLSEQNISDEALSILAALNYSYWCKDEKRKKELLKIYSNNEKNKAKEENQLIAFNNTIENMNEEVKQEVLGLIVYREPKWYQRLFKPLLKIFRRKKSKH